MLIPVVIGPEELVPKGQELDADREVPCMCGKAAKLGSVKLAYVAPVNDPNDIGYRAVCSQGCYVLHCTGGSS